MSGPRHPAPPRDSRWAPLLVAGLSSAGLVGLVLAVDLSMSYRGLTRTRSGEQSDGLHVVDELLGWYPTPGGVGRHRYEGRFDVEYRMDAEGFREVPYRGDPQRQLWLFGDSFTFGQGVAGEDAYPNRIARDYVCFPGDAHWTPAGHAVAAGAVVATLLERGLLEPADLRRGAVLPRVR